MKLWERGACLLLALYCCAACLALGYFATKLVFWIAAVTR